MSYLLDQKRNLGAFIIPVGSNNVVTIFSEFEVIPLPRTTANFAIYNDGTIQLGDNDPLTDNNININAGTTTNFRQLSGTDTSYTLTDNDYSIEVISPTYNEILLPSALNIGGRTYIISNGSTNTSFVVKAQPGDSIDGRLSLNLKRINDHINVQSNGIDDWYII